MLDFPCLSYTPALPTNPPWHFHPSLPTGQVYMQKVKVQRYVTGKRPDYAPSSDEEYASEDEFVAQQQQAPGEAEEPVELTEQERDDPRLRRLQRLQQQRQERDQEQEQDEAADSDGSESAPRRRYGDVGEAGVGRGRECIRHRMLYRGRRESQPANFTLS